MAINSPRELQATGFPSAQANVLHDNFLQKTSTTEIVSGGVTFASAATFQAAVTMESTLAVNGSVTVGDATNDSHTVNGIMSMAAQGHFRLAAPHTGIAALSTTQGSTTALTQALNVIATCVAGSDDAVKLMAAATGEVVVVCNNGASTAQVFPISGGTIGGAAQNAAVKINASTSRLFVGINATTWMSVGGV